MSDKDIAYSIVVPVMNEEDSIPSLAGEIERAMATAGAPWECVWVNDGSTDGTQRVLNGLTGADSPHVIVELDGNFGQSAALAAGFRNARGRFIGTLDGDGQNDPADLPTFFRQLAASTDADMINGYRARRRDSAWRRICSRVANGFRNKMTRESIRDVGCSMRVFRRECVEDLPMFKGLHRFLPTLARMKGFKIAEAPANHRPRTLGHTKYGFFNRFGVGLKDTLAVRWMQQRMVWPKVRCVHGR